MPALFLIWKPLFVPAIAFFMGTMLMFMHLPTGGMRKMPAQEQGRPAEERPAARRTKKGKPVMPSWDEVLLGVKGQR